MNIDIFLQTLARIRTSERISFVEEPVTGAIVSEYRQLSPLEVVHEAISGRRHSDEFSMLKCAQDLGMSLQLATDITMVSDGAVACYLWTSLLEACGIEQRHALAC